MSEEQKGETPPKKRRFRALIVKSFCALIVAAACLLGVEVAMEPMSTAEFCSGCHEMSDAHASWQESPHHTNASGVRVTDSPISPMRLAALLAAQREEG